MEELEAFLLRSIFTVIKLTLEFVVLPLVKFLLQRPILYPAVAAAAWWAPGDHSFWPTALAGAVAGLSVGFWLYLETQAD